MLSGKFWITPTGVVDVSTSEHALYAKNVMLGLLGTASEIRLDKTLFDPLPQNIVRTARRRGVDASVIQHLANGIDARLYVIERWGWVRTRQNAFYLAKFDRKVLRLIRGAAAYWKRQRAISTDDSIDIHETICGSVQSCRLADIMGKRLVARLFK